MKKQKQFEKWANDKLNEIQKILFLNNYDLKPIEFDKDCKDKISYLNFNYPYSTIEVFYSHELYENWEKKKYKMVTGILIHEMCHVLTDELYGKGCSRFCGKPEIEDAREKLTDNLANIILKHNLIICQK